MNFLKRTIVAIIFIPLLLIIAYTSNPVYLFLLLLFVMNGAIFEIYKIEKIKRAFYYFFSFLFSLSYLYYIFLNKRMNLFIYIAFITVFFLYEIVRYNNENERSFSRLLVVFFLNSYIVFFFSYLLLLKLNTTKGWLWTPILFISVWTIDTSAYFIGMLFGKKHRNIFKVSPKKSIEGFLGGIILPTLIFTFFKEKLGLSLNDAILFMTTFSIFVQIGDLVESLLKRYLNVKDSGNLIMGHGGIFDRFDSMIFSAPIFYYLVNFFIERS